MNHLSDPDWIQLVRYLTEESTPEERAEVERWSTDDPQWEHQFERLRRSWEACGPDLLVYDHEALWTSLQRMIQADAEPIPKHAPGRTVRKRGGLGPHPLRRKVGITIGMLGLLVLGFFARPLWREHTPARTLATYATGNGQRATITLVDGTVVTLNAASRLELLEHFGDGARTVRLLGEAYFNVPHVLGTPFIVDAAGTRATVLGTEFGVRAYTPDNVQIAVRNGRVAVGDTVLGGNDLEHLMTGRVMVARHQNVEAALGFATGRLVFTDVTLKAALADLDRWYDVQVRLGDPSLEQVRLHATLMSGSIGDLMEGLRAVLGVRVVRNGRTITLYPQ